MERRRNKQIEWEKEGRGRRREKEKKPRRRKRRKRERGNTVDSTWRRNSVRISFSPHGRDLRKGEVTLVSTDLTSHVHAIRSMELRAPRTRMHTHNSLRLSRERTVIRSNNDTTAVIHPRDCARDKRAFYAAHELRAIIFTSVVYLRARIIRRASGWNKIPFGPIPSWSQFPPFSHRKFREDIFLGANRAPHTARMSRWKLWTRPCDGLESALQRCIRTRYKGI